MESIELQNVVIHKDDSDDQNTYKTSPDEINSFLDPKSIDVFHKIFPTIQYLLDSLKTDEKLGIMSDSLKGRIAKYGDSSLPPPKTKSLLMFIFIAMKEPMVLLLIGAATVTIGFGVYKTATGESDALLDAGGIVLAIVIIIGVNAFNDWNKQRKFRNLDQESKNMKSVKIIRDKEPHQVQTSDLVVGDIMYVAMGDILECDGVLVKGNSVKTDESSVTGESDQIIKDIKEDPFLLSGTTVADGSGIMVVVAVGRNSLQGRSMVGLSADPPPTPLQIKLGKLAKRMAVIGITGAIAFLLLLLVIWIIKGRPGEIIDTVIGIILIGVSIVVMAIPEGLPLAVTSALVFASINMLKDNNLVRHLSACETMGGATTICSDKTGTLTRNQMVVVDSFIFDGSQKDMNVKTTNESVKRLVDNISINSEAYEGIVKNEKKFIGSKTDIALIEWSKTFGYDYKSIRSSADIVETIPFSSERKRMTTIVREPVDRNIVDRETIDKLDVDKNDSNNSQSILVEYTKGAAEIVIGQCSHYDNGHGEILPIDAEMRAKLENEMENFAKKSLRNICCAYVYDGSHSNGQQVNGQQVNGQQVNGQQVIGQQVDGQQDLNNIDSERQGDREELRVPQIFQALFGIEDPLRPNAASSVESCQRAGIVVRMVTGDNATTARSIARQCGILKNEGDLIIEGPVFRKFTPDELKESLPKLRVLARSSPNDKLILVNALKEQGETVAVTGDGANDAPALKNSHVGFSMGLSGTEVAKEASDIVLMDDNFESLVKAIMWGRAVYYGIQKFITFQLSVNISAVILTVVTAFIWSIQTGIPRSGLTTLQILMINIVSDSLAALALSSDKPDASLLDRKPHTQTEHIITKPMWLMIGAQSTYQVTVGLSVYYLSTLFIEDDPVLRGTLLFNTFVLMILFNELNCRSIGKDQNIFRGILKNKFFLPLFVLGFPIQFVVVTYAGVIFDTKPLSPLLWLVSFGLGLGSLPVGYLVRFFMSDGESKRILRQ